MKSYLTNGSNDYFCGVDLAFNKCSCTSSKFFLSDYSLKTINWKVGDSPAYEAWTIGNSVSSELTSFDMKSCGDFLLSPVTTSIEGYTPSRIVSGGFITSTVNNKSSITVTGDNTILGTHNVLF